MDVRRERRRLVEGSDPDEGERLIAAVVAPEGGLAGRAAMDDMRTAAVGRSGNGLRPAQQQFDPLGLDQGVEPNLMESLPNMLYNQKIMPEKKSTKEELIEAPTRVEPARVEEPTEAVGRLGNSGKGFTSADGGEISPTSCA